MVLKSVKRNRQNGGMFRSASSTIKKSIGLKRDTHSNALSECNKLANIFRQIKDSYVEFDRLDKKATREADRYMRQYRSASATEVASSMTTPTPKSRTKKELLKSDILYGSVKDFLKMSKSHKANMNMLHALLLRLRCYIMRYIFINNDDADNTMFKEYSSIFEELRKLFKQPPLDVAIIKKVYIRKKAHGKGDSKFIELKQALKTALRISLKEINELSGEVPSNAKKIIDNYCSITDKNVTIILGKKMMFHKLMDVPSDLTASQRKELASLPEVSNLEPMPNVPGSEPSAQGSASRKIKRRKQSQKQRMPKRKPSKKNQKGNKTKKSVKY